MDSQRNGIPEPGNYAWQQLCVQQPDSRVAVVKGLQTHVYRHSEAQRYGATAGASLLFGLYTVDDKSKDTDRYIKSIDAEEDELGGKVQKR